MIRRGAKERGNMNKTAYRILQAVANSLFPDPPSPKPGPMPSLMEATLQAMRDWQLAEDRFNYVSEPDLVDQTIYTVEACKKRYSYLLGRLREAKDGGGVY